MTGWLLPAAVLGVAVLYAAVGHAGATGYIAVMGLMGLAPEVIRPTALVLNLVVAAIGTAQFVRAGHFRRDLFLPLAVASVPAAAVGGACSLPTAVFEAALGVALACSAAWIVRELRGRQAAGDGPHNEESTPGRRLRPPLLAAVGAGLGLASGLTGVGGGVFLTPLLLALGVATTRQVAAVSVVFILVNSAAGLGGWLASGRSLAAIDPRVVAAAALGGVVGSQFGAFQLPVRWLRLLMAVVLAVASVKLLAGAVGGGAVAAAARQDAGSRFWTGAEGRPRSWRWSGPSRRRPGDTNREDSAHPGSAAASRATSAAKASMSSGLVSQAHIQRTSPVVWFQV
jgi:hypothetical protein